MEDKNQTNTSSGTSEGETNLTPTTATEVTSGEPTMTGSASDSSPVVPATEAMPVADAAVTAPAVTAAATEAVAGTRSSVIKQYAIAFAVVLVMAGGVTYVLIQQGRIQPPAFFAKVTEMVNPAPAAAVVNGVKIPMTDYLKNKAQIEQSATQGGADLTSDTVQTQIKTQALDVLINTEILRQAATKDGVAVTDEQIKARYDEIVTSLQGEDKLIAKMAELNITKEGLMKDIASEILIQTYLAKAVDTSSIQISEEDIKAAYDQANTSPDAKLPPLDQVSSAIEAQLKQTKEQDMINTFIQKLRDEAKIEINV